MILQIAIKEFYNNLLTARFSIGFIMCLFLIPFSLVVNLKDYREQLKGYEIERAKTEKSYQVRVYSALRPEIVRPPEPLSIFSKGSSADRSEAWLFITFSRLRISWPSSLIPWTPGKRALPTRIRASRC